MVITSLEVVTILIIEEVVHKGYDSFGCHFIQGQRRLASGFIPDILKALQLRPIPPDEVNLTPKLIRINH